MILAVRRLWTPSRTDGALAQLQEADHLLIGDRHQNFFVLERFTRDFISFNIALMQCRVIDLVEQVDVSNENCQMYVERLDRGMLPI